MGSQWVPHGLRPSLGKPRGGGARQRYGYVDRSSISSGGRGTRGRVVVILAATPEVTYVSEVTIVSEVTYVFEVTFAPKVTNVVEVTFVPASARTNR